MTTRTETARKPSNHADYIETCDCCGGNLPAPMGRKLDALDRYLVRDDGACTGSLCVDATGAVLGCGAWASGAYSDG